MTFRSEDSEVPFFGPFDYVGRIEVDRSGDRLYVSGSLAGLGSGSVTDMSFRVGRDNTVNFAGVPSGTYYVRVRAHNEVGGSPLSNEVTVNGR